MIDDTAKIVKLLESKQKETNKMLTGISKTLNEFNDNYLNYFGISEEAKKENEELKKKLEEIKVIVSAPFAIQGIGPVDVIKIRKIVC